MLIRGQPYCDHCKQLLQMLDEETALDDMDGHGWHNWKTAHKHYCYDCYDHILEELNYPPCDECETHPCERDPDYCWADGRYPLHLFPYETYFADRRRGPLEREIQAQSQKLLEDWIPK